MIEQLVYYLDNEGPTIVRRISSVLGAFDLQAGMSFQLKVRPRDSSAVVLDRPMVPDVVADTISYPPVAGDFSTSGIFRAWVAVDFGSGVTQDTDEFEILVQAHAPGRATSTGVVYRAARAMAPLAWDELARYVDYGDPELQRQIDLAKLRVLRVATPVADEEALDVRVTDYIARKVLVDSVLEAAIDLWTNTVVSQTSRGNSDQVQTWPDRIAAHERMLVRMKVQLADQLAEVEAILGTGVGVSSNAPVLLGGGPLITPGLEHFKRPWRDRRIGECL